MKLIFLILFTCFMEVSAECFSQEMKVSLNCSEEPLSNVLKDLEKQTKLFFFFNDATLDTERRVSLSMKDISLKRVLDQVLGKEYTWELVNDLIVVKKAQNEPEKKKEMKIVGKVTDKQNLPLPGVTIRVKGAQVGVATDNEGKYLLRLPAMKDFILVFSFVGMETKEVKYVGKDTINVVLNEEKVKMDEVVVTGYVNVRKESFTGNTTTVSRDELMKANNKNVISALQYFDPSFRIRENSLWGSDPNALPEFNIRGESSIAMNKSLDIEAAKQTQRTNLKDNPNLPIFILDGFEVSVQKIYDMDMNRIESMTILKDAAATAMYGSRAANGVVVVTTVAPKPGEIQINYNLTGGLQFPDLSDYNLCNASEKLYIEKLMGKYTAEDPQLQPGKDLEYNKIEQLVLKGVDTDWLSQPLRNAFNHTHSLNLSGGVESIRYGIDFFYDSNNGVMKDSHRSRMGVGLALDYRYRGWLQIMNNITYNSTKTKDSPYGNFSTYAELQPYYALYDDKGLLLERFQENLLEVNPLWKVKYLDNFYGKGRDNDLTNNLSVNVFITDDFQFKGQFSVSKTDSKNESFEDPKDPAFELLPEKERGMLSRTLSESYTWNLNAMFYYNKMMNKHFINAAAGVNMSASRMETTQMDFLGFQLGNLNSAAYAASQPNKTNISTSESRLIGVLGFVNYSYNDVYLFDASFRLDGSSQFGSDKRFAPFWSVGAGVNVHNYSWLKDNWLVSTLKVRATYGTTGKVNFPAYAAVTTFKTNTESWYYTGSSSSLVYLGNPKLTWETTKTLDAGITLGFLNDRITLMASYYHKKTEDLIDEVSVQTSSGFKTYKSNSGSVLNEGFELNLNSVVYADRNLSVVLNARLGANKNEIVELGASSLEYNKKLLENYNSKSPEYADLQDTPLIQYQEGASTTALYAVRSAGIDPANGKERFIKKGGTSTYTWCAEDQVVVGDELPDAQGSFGVNVSFRGFYVNASFLYQWGAQIYNSTLLNKVENADIINKNVDKRILSSRWLKTGDVVPYYDLKNTTKTQPTTRFVQDYDYLSFASLSFGYDFDSELVKKLKLASLGFRFNANDLCRWSTVKEERGTSYPYARSFDFTISVGF